MCATEAGNNDGLNLDQFEQLCRLPMKQQSTWETNEFKSALLSTVSRAAPQNANLSVKKN